MFQAPTKGLTQETYQGFWDSKTTLFTISKEVSRNKTPMVTCNILSTLISTLLNHKTFINYLNILGVVPNEILFLVNVKTQNSRPQTMAVFLLEILNLPPNYYPINWIIKFVCKEPKFQDVTQNYNEKTRAAMISAEQNALGVILYGVHMERRGWGGGGGIGCWKK